MKTIQLAKKVKKMKIFVFGPTKIYFKNVFGYNLLTDFFREKNNEKQRVRCINRMKISARVVIYILVGLDAIGPFSQSFYLRITMTYVIIGIY